MIVMSFFKTNCVPYTEATPTGTTVNESALESFIVLAVDTGSPDDQRTFLKAGLATLVNNVLFILIKLLKLPYSNRIPM